MNKQRLIVSILVAAVLAAGLYFAIRPRERSYEGRGINAWLDAYLGRDSNWQLVQRGDNFFSSPDGREAGPIFPGLREIGVKGIPYILQRTAIGESSSRQKYEDWWGGWPKWLRGITPEPTWPVDPYQAGTLLNIIGPEAIPFAIDALDSQSLRVRLAGLTCLERASLTPQNRRSAITNLTKLLTDPSSQVRQDAAYILGEIGPEASSAVPPLIVNLSDSDISDLNGQVVSVRAHTAQALGKIGPAAKNASPALRRLLTDPDVDLRSEVAVAIWRIDGDVEHTLPVLVAGLPNVDPDMKWQWIDDLGEMGPRASNAFPILVEELKGAEPYNLEKITNAMFKIDPEAAAKLLH